MIYIDLVKNQNHARLFLLSIGILMALAFGFGYEGWYNELDESNSILTQKNNSNSNNQYAVLDTLQYIEKACYEYVSCQSECEENNSKDYLTKTIIKIEKPNGEFEALTENSIKNLPANTSLNLMVEQYKIERSLSSDGPSFHVTMEAFNTQLEIDRFHDLKRFPFSDPEASLSIERFEQIKSALAGNLTMKTPEGDFRLQ
jgi:hypothetical protein